MTNGDLNAEQLTQYYLQRINTHNRQGANLRAVNSVNENALKDARRLDAEREQGKVRGPLHGIPVLLKTTSIPPTVWQIPGFIIVRRKLPGR